MSIIFQIKPFLSAVAEVNRLLWLYALAKKYQPQLTIFRVAGEGRGLLPILLLVRHSWLWGYKCMYVL
jgi:hypothetical protein